VASLLRGWFFLLLYRLRLKRGRARKAFLTLGCLCIANALLKHPRCKRGRGGGDATTILGYKIFEIE